jgi:hypothetical protein
MEKLLNSFKKIYPDHGDTSYFYYRKDFKHPLIKGLHIIVDKTITVYGREPKNKIGKMQNGRGLEYVIAFKRRTPHNLNELLEMFN